MTGHLLGTAGAGGPEFTPQHSPGGRLGLRGHGSEWCWFTQVTLGSLFLPSLLRFSESRSAGFGVQFYSVAV